MLDSVAKSVIHVLSGNRRFYYRKLRELAPQSVGKVVLELGSGKAVDGEYTYSAHHLFPDAAEFVCTDVNPAFGHRVLDVTEMDDRSAYDIILCLNVLEHVYDHARAIENMRTALTPGGTLCVAVPFAFPLHDEPGDYWRFTEHALRRMLADFADVTITPQRSRRFPTGYFVLARTPG